MVLFGGAEQSVKLAADMTLQTPYVHHFKESGQIFFFSMKSPYGGGKGEKQLL